MIISESAGRSTWSAVQWEEGTVLFRPIGEEEAGNPRGVLSEISVLYVAVM